MSAECLPAGGNLGSGSDRLRHPRLSLGERKMAVPDSTFDVIVSGGDPVGATAAHALALDLATATVEGALRSGAWAADVLKRHVTGTAGAGLRTVEDVTL